MQQTMNVLKISPHGSDTEEDEGESAGVQRITKMYILDSKQAEVMPNNRTDRFDKTSINAARHRLRAVVGAAAAAGMSRSRDVPSGDSLGDLLVPPMERPRF